MPRAARIRTQRTDSSSPISLSRRRLLGIGLGAGALFALEACGGGTSTPTGAGASGGTGTITWAWQLPTTWDPVTSSAGSDVQMLALTYDALTALDDSGQRGRLPGRELGVRRRRHRRSPSPCDPT